MQWCYASNEWKKCMVCAARNQFVSEVLLAFSTNGWSFVAPIQSLDWNHPKEDIKTQQPHHVKPNPYGSHLNSCVLHQFKEPRLVKEQLHPGDFNGIPLEILHNVFSCLFSNACMNPFSPRLLPLQKTCLKLWFAVPGMHRAYKLEGFINGKFPIAGWFISWKIPFKRVIFKGYPSCLESFISAQRKASNRRITFQRFFFKNREEKYPYALCHPITLVTGYPVSHGLSESPIDISNPVIQCNPPLITNTVANNKPE